MRLTFSTKQAFIPRLYKTISWPVVELAILSEFHPPIRQKVLIDTGSTNSIFPISLAPYMGISDIRELPTIQLGAGAGVVKAYVTQASLSIETPGRPDTGWEWTGEIVLANVRTSHYGVLGHLGFLEYFDFELRSEMEQFSLEDNSRFAGQKRESTHHDM